MQRAPSRARRGSRHALLVLLVMAWVRGGEALFGGAAQQAMALPTWHPARFRKAPVELQRQQEAKDAGEEVGTVGTPSVVAARPPEEAAAQTNAINAQPSVPPVYDVPSANKPNAAIGEFTECETCGRCDPNQLITHFEDTISETHVNGIKPKYARCELCTGCTHDITKINLENKMFDRTLTMMSGNTGASIYTTPAPEVPHGLAVIKVHGVASDMVAHTRVEAMMRHYPNKRHYKIGEVEMMKMMMKVSDECGFPFASIREWTANMRVVIPGLGERVEEKEGIFAEYARGVSLEVLNLKVAPHDVMDLMTKVSSTKVHEAALFDLLTAQGDRHGENVFMEQDGSMKLIDTRDSAFSDLDSIFLPGTFIPQRARLGNDGVFERSTVPNKSHWPMLTLDYRCHTPGGYIGKRFPKKMKQCMQKFAKMTIPQLMEYGFPAARQAERLSMMSRNLLQYGFEESIRLAPKRISYRNQPKEGYPLQEPCCILELPKGASHKLYECKPRTLPDTHDDDYYYVPEGSANQSFGWMSGVPGTVPTVATGVPEGSAVAIAGTGDDAAAAAPGGGSVIAPASAPEPAGPGPLDDDDEEGSGELQKVDQSGWDEARKRAAAAALEVFAFLPEHFDPQYKNPCWRDAAGLHCLPYFHILGVSKCGTTDLYRRLSTHNNIVRSLNKGPHFWDEKHTFKWYLDIFQRGAHEIETAKPKTGILGDASSNTLTYSGVGIQGRPTDYDGNPWTIRLPEVLYQAQKDLKLIVMLRNPADRMYSAFYYYGHYGTRYGSHPEGFHTYAQAMVDSFKECVQAPGMSNRLCATQRFSNLEQLVKGLYGVFLADWLSVFPAEQMLILKSEEYYADVKGSLQRVVAFLGMDEPTVDEWQLMLQQEPNNQRRTNGEAKGASQGDMLPQTRQLLDDFYRPFNQMLADLLRDTKWKWTT